MTELAATGILSRYTVLARENAAQSAAYAAAVIDAARLGLIPVSDVAGYLREVIGAAAVTAALLADIAVAADLTRRTGNTVPPLSLDLPEEFVGPITTGIDTIVSGIDWPAVREDDDEALAVIKRVQRFATAIPLDAGEAVQTEALCKRDVVLWTRGTDANPCPLCRGLADGTVLPLRAQMIRHPNCCCVRLPILDPDVEAGDKVTAVPDVHEGPQRTLSTGHGLGRYERTQYGPGLTFSRHAPRTSVGADRYDPRFNGATEAARRANRGRRVGRPLAPVYDLNDYRKRKHG